MIILLILLFSVLSDYFELMTIGIRLLGIKRRLIVVKAVLERIPLLKNFTEFLIVDFFEALAWPKSEELHELSKFLVQFWQARVLPDFFNLFEGKETVTVFIVQI